MEQLIKLFRKMDLTSRGGNGLKGDPNQCTLGMSVRIRDFVEQQAIFVDTLELSEAPQD